VVRAHKLCGVTRADLNPNFPIDHKPPLGRPVAYVVTDHPHAGNTARLMRAGF